MPWAALRALPFHQCGLGSILAQTLHVGLVCWFSTLLQEVIPWVLQVSPLTKTQKKTKYLLCICAPLNPQRLTSVVRTTKFLANFLTLPGAYNRLLTLLLFLPHTSQPCLEPKLHFLLGPFNWLLLPL